MSLLDGEIAELFGSVFSELYLDGVLTRVALTDNGKGGGVAVPTPQPCKVQIDACTEAMRGQDGYTDRDVRLLILRSGVEGGELDTECIVTPSSGPYAGTSFAVATWTTDPAGSYWECRGTLTDPT